MHPGNCLFHRAQNVAIVEGGEVVWQPALDANFARAQLPSLNRLLRHLIETQKIRIVLTRPPAESAELATDEADVGEINVAVTYAGDEISCELRAKFVRGHQQSQ